MSHVSTCISVMACAAALADQDEMAITPEQIECLTRQGTALAQTIKDTASLSSAKEIIELVSPALPICCAEGKEFQGLLNADSLTRALELFAFSQLAVLTVEGGDKSVALFKAGAAAFYGGACFTFESRDQLIAFLLEHFSTLEEEETFSFCTVRRRMHHMPRTFSKQGKAFTHADRLPRGFYYIFARDVNKDGMKEYQVAGLADFYDYYSKLEPERRTHYDMARANTPVTLYMDPEFEVFAGRNVGKNGRKMLEALIRLVAQVWAEEMNVAVEDVMPGFVVTDSSTEMQEEDMEEEEEEVVVMMGEEEEEEEAGADDAIPMEIDQPSLRVPKQKVSFHVHNQSMWFPSGPTCVGDFMRRVEKRAAAEKEQLFVWRRRNKKNDEDVEWKFFADMKVYTPNRCFRLPMSTKYDEARPFLPLDSARNERQVFCQCILSPPVMADLYKETAVAPLQEQDQRSIRSSIISYTTGSSSSSILQLSCAPPAICLLAGVIEQHFKPQRMTGFLVDPTGLITFPMIKHDCSICSYTHDNQCYAVADLKTRVFYAKCHRDRSKMGVHVPFPADLNMSLCVESELQQPGSFFNSNSSTARMVLGFANAIFASSAERIPETALVHYHAAKHRYEAALSSACHTDQGEMVLQVTLEKLVIRCKGKVCSAKGKRKERPSHSSKQSGLWNLSFLFPTPTEVVTVAASPSPCPRSPNNEPSFLAETNFYRALGLEEGRASNLSIYAERLKQVAATCQSKEAQDKVRVMSKILLDDFLEACYYECLILVPNFSYPLQLVPRPKAMLLAVMEASGGGDCGLLSKEKTPNLYFLNKEIK